MFLYRKREGYKSGVSPPLKREVYKSGVSLPISEKFKIKWQLDESLTVTFIFGGKYMQLNLYSVSDEYIEYLRKFDR